MKNLKLSFAVIVAILAVSVAVVTKAHTFGKKQVTSCFATLVATNGTNQQSLVNLNCAQARAVATGATPTHPYVASASSPINEDDVCIQDITYCCAKVEETTNTSAPLINLGDGLKRYRIAQVFCKPQ